MSESNEIDRVRGNLDQWLKAFNANDAETLFTLYDLESLYLNAGAPLMRGETEVRP